MSAATYAKELGQTALGLTDHGTVSGLIEHYTSCKKAGIKPVLGVEAYFQPNFDKDKPRYHLTLFAESTEGYHNLMRMLTVANERFYHYKPICDLKLLKQHQKGVICLSGCLAGAVSRYMIDDKLDTARRLFERFKDIYGDRFYAEVQPYDVFRQLDLNAYVIDLAKSTNTQVVMTADSHYVRKDEYTTYQMMYKLANKEPSADYEFRYMPSEEEMLEAWASTMVGSAKEAQSYLDEAQKLADRCEVSLSFTELVPKIDWGMDSRKKLTTLAVEGLKAKGAWKPDYKQRLKSELETVLTKHYEDYFLLCYDILEYAKSKRIAVGYGRGSVCGSLLAYAIGITNVDPLVFKTSFERFLRPNKTTMPDIDIDFDSDRRQEVIEYITTKYSGRAAPITTFGYYKVRNLVNDLAKQYDMPVEDRDAVKGLLETMEDASSSAFPLTHAELLHYRGMRKFDEKYPEFLMHFLRLYGQIRFLGRHASGIAITAEEIGKYVALMRVRGELQTSYDLDSLGTLNIVKMDILGLSTVSVVHDASKAVGVEFTYDILNDRDTYQAFADGNTDGVFQFEKQGAKGILRKVQPTTIQDLIACNALNRPAPIQLGLLDEFILGKNGEAQKASLLHQYASDTYGTLIYQEHVMNICRGVANMDWADVDKVMKSLRQTAGKEDPLERAFIEGAKTHSGLSKHEASDLYKKMTLYLFNKGHGAGYTLLSYYAMWLKLNYPLEFWSALLRHEGDEYKRRLYKSSAVKDGVIVLLPHVNGTARDSTVEFMGAKVLQEGLLSIKAVGQTSAYAIEKGRPYESEEDLLERIPKRLVNSRILEALRELGAVEFTQAKYLRRVERYNSTLYSANLSLR